MRRTRKQLYEHIDGDYYGYRDEEDGILVKVEAAAEAVMRKEVGFVAANLRLCFVRWYRALCASVGQRCIWTDAAESCH